MALAGFYSLPVNNSFWLSALITAASFCQIPPWLMAFQAQDCSPCQVFDWVKVTQSCFTLCNPMAYTVHGILQARIMEWVAIPRLQGIIPTQRSNPGLLLCRRFFTSWAIREAQEYRIHLYLSFGLGMATHSSILHCRIPRTVWGLKESDTTEQLSLSLLIFWASFSCHVRLGEFIRLDSHGALISIVCSNINGAFSYEGPDSKYFQLYGSYSFRYIYSILLL